MMTRIMWASVCDSHVSLHCYSTNNNPSPTVQLITKRTMNVRAIKQEIWETKTKL